MIHFVLAATIQLGTAKSSGQALYELKCSSCHGMVLQGSPAAPPLIGVGAAHVDFMLQTGRMPVAISGVQPLPQAPQMSQSDIRAIVRYVTSTSRGKAPLPRPAQGRSHFTQANIRALVREVAANAKDSQGIPQLAKGNVEHGRAVFAENCEQCHGASAHGGSVGYAIVAPSLMQTHPEQIAEAVRVGPGEMPRFGTDVISASSLDDVVSYVEFLQSDKRAYNPGGLALANLGPVAEGFIAWMFGLGILVLFVRLIGSTT